jgi:hypothetical protein
LRRAGSKEGSEEREGSEGREEGTKKEAFEEEDK